MVCLLQGEFPETNTKDDGYHGTCPVNAFEPQNAKGQAVQCIAMRVYCVYEYGLCCN